MTEASAKSEPRWTELSGDVLESVEYGRKQVIEALRFVEQISPALTSVDRDLPKCAAVQARYE